jgi:hypothetical protein
MQTPIARRGDNRDHPLRIRHYAWILLPALFLGQVIAQTSRRATDLTKQCASIRRREKLPDFGDFPAPKDGTSKPASPILATAKDRKFRTIIRTEAAKGPNFAGHYTIVDWGCGTGCHEFVIADENTGTVYDPYFQEVDHHYPTEYLNTDSEWWCYAFFLNYQLDSRLLVVEGCLSGKQCGRSYFMMDPSGLHLIRHDPDLLNNGKNAPY